MSVITLTGPTCAGKSTIERELQRLGCGRAISHTTRARRIGENHGEHYHFVTGEEFDRLEQAYEFIEVVTFGTKRYGMSKGAIHEALTRGEHVAIVVDPHGAEQIGRYCIKERLPHCAVWIDCDPKEQARRFMTRLTQDMLIGREAVDAHVERLGLMLSQETVWRQAARNNRISLGAFMQYSQYIESTSAEPAELAKQLLEDLTGKVRVRKSGGLPLYIDRPDLH
jgi:guanylate kinase